ncbi:MAG TPA: cell division protein FtsZ [Proteobacteria bacterium]|jgi:cell division protein FtsZ|nr:cell division protein FtsZ [Pseudomonadota bacterium]
MSLGMHDENQQVANIKVIGIGGGGSNAIDHMINEKVAGVTFLCANTDLQALQRSKAHMNVQLGEEITKGLGAGANPDIGRQAACETKEQVKQSIEGADMLFITAGMGGGTGTGGAPVVAEIAREMGILTVAVVTKPFLFEGKKRMDFAIAGIAELRKHVDSLIIIPNNKLLSVLGKSVTLLSAFRAANAVLQGAVEGISNLVTLPGLINVDFADVRTVMSEMGMAMMGSGNAKGEDRARCAAEAAISSPLLEDIDLSGAKGVLVNITAGSDMSIGEFEIVGDTIRDFTSEQATVVVGTVIEPDMQDEMKVTIVVTGLDETTDGSDAGVVRRSFRDKLSTMQDRSTESRSTLTSGREWKTDRAAPAAAARSPIGTDNAVQPAATSPDTASTGQDSSRVIDIPAFLRRQEVDETEEA